MICKFGKCPFDFNCRNCENWNVGQPDYDFRFQTTVKTSKIKKALRKVLKWLSRKLKK